MRFRQIRLDGVRNRYVEIFDRRIPLSATAATRKRSAGTVAQGSRGEDTTTECRPQTCQSATGPKPISLAHLLPGQTGADAFLLIENSSSIIQPPATTGNIAEPRRQMGSNPIEGFELPVPHRTPHRQKTANYAGLWRIAINPNILKSQYIFWRSGRDSNSGAKRLIFRRFEFAQSPRYLGMCLVDFLA